MAEDQSTDESQWIQVFGVAIRAQRKHDRDWMLAPRSERPSDTPENRYSRSRPYSAAAAAHHPVLTDYRTVSIISRARSLHTLLDRRTDPCLPEATLAGSGAR